MYMGYIAEPSQSASRYGWHSAYSSIAYLAQKYDVARTQLEAVDWTPNPNNLSDWGTDMSLMALEVAARTGPLNDFVNAAESNRLSGDITTAIKIYSSVPTAVQADQRTAQFIRDRLVTLDLERRYRAGEWVGFLPAGNDFVGWCVGRGNLQKLPDGGLEVSSDEGGHILYSRARFGMGFEVKGSFEVMRSSNGAFQAGLVMGIPEFNSSGWYSFRMKRNNDEGEIAVFATQWTRNGPYNEVTLNSKTNSFYFRLEGRGVSASVNGQEILKEVLVPQNRSINTNEFLLGLGAFNDMNHTVIRYRNIQVHRL